MAQTLNISAYKFVPVPEPQVWQGLIRERASALGLKGTVLLATEGINLFLAGAPEKIAACVDYMRSAAEFGSKLADLAPKESWSDAQPFRKLLVKVKPEIIRMNCPAILPDFSRADGRAPAVDAFTLKRWLDAGHDDEGRPVVTLDTRNAFEVDHGSFDGAIDWRIHKFSEFPQAFADHLPELRDKTVVSFCTGGIRCEKAAIYMRGLGHEHVYQLDGGILKYFELAGGAHYHGDCFVFDEREALDPSLAPRQGA